jgi:hypothetical protein
VKIGNCIKTIEKATISNPIQMLNRRDLLALELTIPVATRSMPITSNITDRIIIIEKIAEPMYSIMTRESVMQIVLGLSATFETMEGFLLISAIFF